MSIIWEASVCSAMDGLDLMDLPSAAATSRSFSAGLPLGSLSDSSLDSPFGRTRWGSTSALLSATVRIRRASEDGSFGRMSSRVGTRSRESSGGAVVVAFVRLHQRLVAAAGLRLWLLSRKDAIAVVVARACFGCRWRLPLLGRDRVSGRSSTGDFDPPCSTPLSC
jgi:hypothetical protein